MLRAHDEEIWSGSVVSVSLDLDRIEIRRTDGATGKLVFWWESLITDRAGRTLKLSDIRPGDQVRAIGQIAEPGDVQGSRAMVVVNR
jgi:hypothetical protein